MENVVISPKSLSFVTTDKCTASCKNCCFGCNPQNKQTLTLDEMKKYMLEASQYTTLKQVIFTGGECFLLKYLDEAIEYASF